MQAGFESTSLCFKNHRSNRYAITAFIWSTLPDIVMIAPAIIRLLPEISLLNIAPTFLMGFLHPAYMLSLEITFLKIYEGVPNTFQLLMGTID